MDKFKICSKCKKEKSLLDFYKDNRNKDGLRSHCKKCIMVYSTKYHQDHKAERNDYIRNSNIEKKPKRKAYKKAYYQKNKDKIIIRQKIYNNKHRIEISKYFCSLLKSNISYRLNRLMGSSIWKILKSKKDGKSWIKYTDYTLGELVEHLKSTLPKGYTWDDYINGADLHIDHIIPKSIFNITSMECTDFKRCWSLNNLQLLPAKENLIKGAKLNKPFQPSLTGF